HTLAPTGFQQQTRRPPTKFKLPFPSPSRKPPAVEMILNDSADTYGAHVDLERLAEVRGLEDAIFAPVFGEDGFHLSQRQRVHAPIEAIDRRNRRLLAIINISEAMVIGRRQAEDQTQSANVTGGDLFVADKLSDRKRSGFYRIDRVFPDRISG